MNIVLKPTNIGLAPDALTEITLKMATVLRGRDGDQAASTLEAQRAEASAIAAKNAAELAATAAGNVKEQARQYELNAAGSATSAANAAETASTKASEAAASATSASTSAAVATTKANEASSSATTASSSAATAAAKAADAANSAVSAFGSASVATSKADTATSKAAEAIAAADRAADYAMQVGANQDAYNSAIDAKASKGAAVEQANLAKDWATKTSGEVINGAGYSAKKYATDAASSASTASTAATNAAASASSASTSASTATTQAGIATTQAGVATTQADVARTAANAALHSRNQSAASEQACAAYVEQAAQTGAETARARAGAEAARDAAQLAAGVYANTTAGLAATTSGEYFSVPASADDVLILYKNNAGSAVEQFRYPSAVSVSKRLELVDGTLDNGAEVALVIHDAADRVVAWVDVDAIWHFPTMPGLAAVGSAFTDLENDPDWLIVFVDNQDRIAWGIRNGGAVYPEAAPAKDGLSYSEVFHFVLHGQSLAEGDESLPIVSSASSGFGNYRFSRGVRTWSSSDNPTTPALRAASGFSFNDLIADANGGFGETIANGVADGYKASFGGRYSVNAQASLNPHVLVSYAGRGSTRLTQLNSEDTGRTDSRDTHAAPGGYWLTMLDDITRAKNSAASAGKSYAVAGLIYMQGERDSDLRIYEWEDPRTPSNHFATWRDKFKAMADEFDSSARAITGQLRKIPTFLYQTSNNIIGNAQLAAEEEHVDIYMIGPTYAVPSALNGSYLSGATQVWGNSIHLSADGQRWFGEQAAKVMRRTLVEKEDWRPLRPLRAKKINSTTVDVEFHVPRPPLVVDTNFLAKCVNFGFAAYAGTIDARGARCDVSNVEVVGGGTTLRLTFSTALPAGAFLSSGVFSTCDLGASYAVSSVGTATPSSTGFSRYSLTITGDIRSQLKPLTDEGAFNLYANNSAGVIREVQLVSGNTVLIGEDRELRTGGSYRPFLSGDVLTFGRPFAYTNLRDSDNEGSLNTFASTAYGTRAGKRYPLWNWCALFDNFTIIGA